MDQMDKIKCTLVILNPYILFNILFIAWSRSKLTQDQELTFNINNYNFSVYWFIQSRRRTFRVFFFTAFKCQNGLNLTPTVCEDESNAF